MRNRLFWALLLLSSLAVTAEIDNFAFRREIVGAAPGWGRIVLPDSVYSKIDGAMNDLRIAGVRPNGERFEVPYLLRQTGEAKDREVAFKILNRVRGQGGSFVTFEVPSAEAVNAIDVTISKEDFDWQVRLEGSNDQREWFGLLHDYRIVGFRNNFASYNFTTLRFPDSKFRYLRLFVPAADPGIERASLYERGKNEGTLRQYPVRSFKVSEDRPYRVSVIDIELAERVPLSSIRLRVRDRIDFYRPVAVEFAAGENADGQPIFRRGAAGIFSSFDPEPLRFPVFAADRLRITVSNQDNPPLDLEAPEIAGTPYELVAQFPEPASYFLIYSKPETVRPRYDVEIFADRIPPEIAELKLGDEVRDGDRAAADPRWMTSPVWLWPVIIAAIALMGFFALRMLKSPQKR
jgi:hypothetical protein